MVKKQTADPNVTAHAVLNEILRHDSGEQPAVKSESSTPRTKKRAYRVDIVTSPR